MQAIEPFFLTTPLYYVNAQPHLGSAYTTIAADAIARFHRLLGDKVILLTGVDEHGGKIEATAKTRELNPQEHCDEITQSFLTLWQDLKISYNFFSRTTNPKHKQKVQAFFQKVQAKGDIYEADYKGLYCLACEDFKSERELLEGKLCSTHLTPVQEYAETNLFFALSKYTEPLKTFFRENPDFVKPAFRKHEIEALLAEGLRDFPISRRGVKWGIEVPDKPEQTIYVWFDALLGYLSPFSDEDNPRASLHLIGKDILRFHALYWPAMLMSAELPLPKMVFGHGFLTMEGEKMGKTRGNVIYPHDLLYRFGIDAMRFYFLFSVPFGQDGDYSEKVFVQTVNAYLANRLGNLFSRVIKLKSTYKLEELTEAQLAMSSLRESLETLPAQVKACMEELDLSGALGLIFAAVDAMNLLLTEQKPWTLLKSAPDSAEYNAGSVAVQEVFQGLFVVAQLLCPFMPSLGEKMLAVFGLTEPRPWAEIAWKSRFTLDSTLESLALFSRIEG